ncbi:MAG TPA: bifunctional YncE family protein/alkaline phosphatase family protein, partial [Blastocatellia bacterium]|nr:bifunctional YncE family protein/alkaline phosphatase family protein [Blastocatellia bacterium]
MHRKSTVIVAIGALACFSLAAIKAHLSTGSAPPMVGDAPRTLPNGWRISPAGRQVQLPGDLVFKMLVTPDGKSLLVNTGGFHDHNVSIIDLATEKVQTSVDVWKDWAGMAFEPSSQTVFVSGGGPPGPLFAIEMKKRAASPLAFAETHHPVLRVSLKQDGKSSSLDLGTGLEITGLAERDRFVAGMATGPGGVLYVVNTDNDTVYRLSGEGYGTQSSVKVGYRPYGIALAPDSQTIAVSNWGDESVSLLDARTFQETARVKVGSHPNELVFGKDGRLWVACSVSNSVSVIQGAQVIETVKTSLDPADPVGSTPDALVLSPDGKTLYVANADNNDIAVINVSDKKESKVIGFIPTGWYPSALAISPDGKRLFAGVGKGLYSRANAPARGGDRAVSSNATGPYDYIGRVLNGGVSIIDLPDRAELDAYSRQVIANRPRPETLFDQFQARRIQRDVFAKIKHVVYIIRENRTYDQVFGDLGTGNGDPKLAFFGEQVTPNAHRLARQTVVLDNLYCNGEVSEDGHQWCMAAYATDFTEKAWPNSYSGRGEPQADQRLTSSPAGYLWDSCARKGLSYRSYGEFEHFKSSPDAPPRFEGHEGLEGHASESWDRLDKGIDARDTDRAEAFIAELKEAEKTGEWPSMLVLHAGEDHTEGLAGGRLTPVAHVASNDQALGRIVEAVSRSRFWPETAIFVIEDDAQNGADHVDAHRTVGMVISPYVKRGVVDSTMYSTASMVRTMELILGLPPMSQYDRAATPMYNSFTAAPVMDAYASLPAKVDLQARNPRRGPLARASAKLDFSDYDRADPDELNRILWRAFKGDEPMPA